MAKQLGKQLRAEFPIFGHNERVVGGKKLPLVYLDTAATAQKPRAVIDAMSRYLEQDYGPVHRGVYSLSARSSELYEGARQIVARFISPKLSSDEIVFTRGTTESLNILANGIAEAYLNESSRIVVPAVEHHANLIPWQQAALRKNCELAYIPLLGKRDSELTLNLKAAEKLITKETKVVALAHVGNVLGQINPIAEIAKMAKAVGALVIVDSAQSISSFTVDPFACGVDAVAFSAHKMYGPTGIGILAAKRELLAAIDPLVYGGGMISDVTLEGCEWAPIPGKFEAGTPSVTEIVGLTETIRWLEEVGRAPLHSHTAKLAHMFCEALRGIPGIEVFSPSTGQETIVSFRHSRVHAHDLATLLDADNVAMRAGHHCAWPLVRLLGTDALVRASFGAYSDEEDVDRALSAIKKSINFL